jgi:hypothetical protein
VGARSTVGRSPGFQTPYGVGATSGRVTRLSLCEKSGTTHRGLSRLTRQAAARAAVGAWRGGGPRMPRRRDLAPGSPRIAADLEGRRAGISASLDRSHATKTNHASAHRRPSFPPWLDDHVVDGSAALLALQIPILCNLSFKPTVKPMGWICRNPAKRHAIFAYLRPHVTTPPLPLIQILCSWCSMCSFGQSPVLN